MEAKALTEVIISKLINDQLIQKSRQGPQEKDFLMKGMVRL